MLRPYKPVQLRIIAATANYTIVNAASDNPFLLEVGDFFLVVS